MLAYPCQIPVDSFPDGGEAPHLLAIDGHTCIILFTKEAAVRAYVADRYGGNPPGHATVNVFNSAAELLRYLKHLEPAAAEQEAFHVAYNPSPPRTVYVPLRDLVAQLEREASPPAE
jgi:hypothetical protein